MTMSHVKWPHLTPKLKNEFRLSLWKNNPASALYPNAWLGSIQSKWSYWRGKSFFDSLKSNLSPIIFRSPSVNSYVPTRNQIELLGEIRWPWDCILPGGNSICTSNMYFKLVQIALMYSKTLVNTSILYFVPCQTVKVPFGIRNDQHVVTSWRHRCELVLVRLVSDQKPGTKTSTVKSLVNT